MPATFVLFLLHGHCVFKPRFCITWVSDMHLGQCMDRRVNGKGSIQGHTSNSWSLELILCTWLCSQRTNGHCINFNTVTENSSVHYAGEGTTLVAAKEDSEECGLKH